MNVGAKLAIAGILFAFVAGVQPAKADFSACESAYKANNPSQQIDLYTICITKSGMVGADRAGAFNNRGLAYLAIGDRDKAFQDFTWSIESDPNWATAYENRGQLYLSKSDWANALADFDKAIHSDASPGDRPRQFYLRGLVHARLGQFEAAIADQDEAIKRNHKYHLAYNMEAWLLATCPDPRLRNGAKAIQLGQQALMLSDDPRAHETLAAAYAEAGRFDDAVNEEGKAIDGSKGMPPSGSAQRLELYRSHMPYREPQVVPARVSG